MPEFPLTEAQQQMLVTQVREMDRALSDAGAFIWANLGTRAGDHHAETLRDFQQRLYDARLEAGLT